MENLMPKKSLSKKPWDGRFSEETDKSVEAFTSSINIDKRLYAYDIEGSIAHCKMLVKTSIISEKEGLSLIHGLNKIKEEIDQKRLEIDNSFEDIHMYIEARLTKEVGSAALKLHTARSRNDQVALDARLYLRKETSLIIRLLWTLKKVIVDLAQEHLETILPGYTHLQRAQPVLLSHHLMAYYEMLSRDYYRFKDCVKRINVMPLGAAALAGTTYPIDRELTAKLLDFPEVSANSIDAVSDRDFIMEFLSAASICMVHFSRLSEELILWSSAEFNFLELPDAFATGSSIMPQKKNPDVPELVRGKAGRIFGNLTGMLCMMKSLPLAYNRDMQEDKEPLFDTVDTLKACIEIYIKMLPKLKFNKEVMYQSTTKGFLNATDMADYLVKKGLPFREAHHCTGKVVNYAISNSKELHELKLEELISFSSLFDKNIFHVLSVSSMINQRTTFGATAKENVQMAIQTARRQIDEYEF